MGGLAVSTYATPRAIYATPRATYATPRATQGIDLLVAPDDLPRLVDALGALGDRDLRAPAVFAGNRIEPRRFTGLAGDCSTLRSA